MPLRPDLVIINDTDKVLHIVDVIIPLKSSETARAEKVSKKYTPLSDWFTSREYSASVSVFVVGSLGGWDSANDVVHYMYLKLSYFKIVYMFNLSCMHLLLLILSQVHLRGHDQRWSQPFCCCLLSKSHP